MAYSTSMAYSILMLAIVIAIAVVPVMLAARAVGAGRRGFWPVLLAVFLQGALSGVVQQLADSPVFALAVAIVLGPAIYAYVLSTSWLKGLLIGLLSVVIALGTMLVLGAVLGSVGRLA